MASYKLDLLSDDPESYRQAFDVFQKRSTSSEKYYEFLKNVTTTLNMKIAQDNQFRILGVGSGTGDKDCMIIDSLLEKYSNIHETVVEPNTGHVAEFEDRVKREMQGKAVQFDWRNGTVEEFLKTVNGNKQKYHFIHCIHSLYYTSNQNDVISKLYDLLMEDGTLMIIHQSGKSDLWKIYMEVQKYIKTSGRRNRTSGEDSFELLRSRHCACTFDVLNIEVDIGVCVDEESDPGNKLINFLTDVVDFRRTAPRDLKESVLQMVNSAEVGIDHRPYFSDIPAKILVTKKECHK